MKRNTGSWLALVGLLLCLGHKAEAETRPVVAVLYFDNNTGLKAYDTLRKGMADMLITDLSQSNDVILVEREKLHEVFSEIELQKSGYFDKKTTVRLGKGLGAQYAISGSFQRQGKRIRVDVRMVSVKTGTIELGTSAMGRHDELFAIEAKLAKKLRKKLRLRGRSAGLPSLKAPPIDALLKYSKGLDLIDSGKKQQAKKVFTKLVSQHPTFGLARTRKAELLKKFNTTKVRRDMGRARANQELFRRVDAHLRSHKISRLTRDEATLYLSYRAIRGRLIGRRLADAHPKRRLANARLPLAGKKNESAKLTRLLYENYRALIREKATRVAMDGRVDWGPKFPKDIQTLLEATGLEFPGLPRFVDPESELAEFLLHGQVLVSRPKRASATIVPVPVYGIPSLRRPYLRALRAELARRRKKATPPHDTRYAYMADTLSRYHSRINEVETAVRILQRVLDRIPNSHRAGYIELRVKELLGTKHNFRLNRRVSWARGLKECNSNHLNAGRTEALTIALMRFGDKAFEKLGRDLERCKGTKLWSSINQIIYRYLTEAAGHNGRCTIYKRMTQKYVREGGDEKRAKETQERLKLCLDP